MREAEARFEQGSNEGFSDLESFADSLSEALQAQLTIEDHHHHVIAYSSHPYENDHARLATIVGRRVPETVVAELRKCGVMQELEAASRAVRIPAIQDVGLGPRLAVCIKRQEEVLGYIWVVDTGQLVSGKAERILEQAAETAKHYLVKRRSRRVKQEHLQHEFYWKMITGYTKSEAQMVKDALDLSIELPPCYCLIMLACPQAITEQQLGVIRRILAEEQLEPVLLVADHAEAIGIIPAQRKPSDAERTQHAQITPHTQRAQRTASRLGRVIDRLQSERGMIVTAGSSRAENCYVRAADAYKEVRTLLVIKAQLPYQTRDVWHYDDLGFFMHVPSIMEHKKKEGRYSAYLARLREHDKEQRSDLLKTIAYYLSCDCNPKLAASRMHVHVNTLHYRLNKIAELTGHHLRETNYLLSLYVDLLTEEIELMKGVHGGG